MKKSLVLGLALLSSLVSISQRVGIGTSEPISKLSIDSGLNIDQANINGIGLESALTFGNNKKVGIGSRRTSGANQAGLDFYTQGFRRMVLDSFGNVGIGITTPSRLLHVNGMIYSGSFMIASFGISAGRGNLPPDYDVHAPIGYFTTRAGIGTIPNSNYALDIGTGSVRMQGAVRIEGVLNPNNALTIGNNTTVQGSVNVNNTLVVRGNRGIVRSQNSTQLKIVRTTVTLTGILNAGAYVDSDELGFETFGSVPQVYMGNMVSANNDAWARLVFIPFEVDTNSCRFRVFNHGSSAANVQATYSLMIIGPE